MTCIHGPNGSGKHSLLKQLESVHKTKHFVWFKHEDHLMDKLYLNNLSDDIHCIRHNVVLCIPHVELFSDDQVVTGYLFAMIRKLLNDTRIDLKIVLIVDDISLLDNRIKRITDKFIFVRDMKKCEKRDFLKHLICERTGGDPAELELDELTNHLSGFTAQNITTFIDAVHRKFPELKVDQLLQCVGMKEFIPLRLSDLTFDIDRFYWSDIGGYDNVKQLLQEEIAVPLKYGNKLPKGILLFGPPGCSKTMFVQVLASESGLKLFTIRPSKLMRGLVGESEAILRQILLQALACAPSIVFIDEIDTLLPRRSSSNKVSVSENLLNELMTFLDGAETKRDERVILMGATNCIDQLDEALIRPGRMDLKIEIGLPDQSSRESILKIVLNNSHVSIDQEVLESIPFIAKALENRSGAEIVNIGRRIINLSEIPEDGSLECWKPDPKVTMTHVTQVLNLISSLIL